MDTVRAAKHACTGDLRLRARPRRVQRGQSQAAPSARPIITACMGVGVHEVHGDTRKAFRWIARAGGGAYAEVLTGKPKSDQDASDTLVTQILGISFGGPHQELLDEFVTIFLEYRRRGLFD